MNKGGRTRFAATLLLALCLFCASRALAQCGGHAAEPANATHMNPDSARLDNPAEQPPCAHKCPHAAAGLDPVRRIELLAKTAPRPAGMGGAFTAVADDPIGMWWNPSAAMFGQRLAISGNHSLRHFPHGRKNLDQFDSDTMGVTIPLSGGHMLGLGMTVPGEWGVDYADTNGVLQPTGCARKCAKHKADGAAPCPLEMPERVRGRERRLALGNYRNFNNGNGLAATEIASNWYRKEHLGKDRIQREFQPGAGFSVYYQGNNGFRYGATLRLKKRQRPDEPVKKQTLVDLTLGVAWRDTPQSDTLAALDLQLLTTTALERAQWRYFGGVERGWDDDVFARAGLMNGRFTYGAGAAFGDLRLDYAVVRDLLPDVAGQNPGRFSDGHFLSYTLTD